MKPLSQFVFSKPLYYTMGFECVRRPYEHLSGEFFRGPFESQFFVCFFLASSVCVGIRWWTEVNLLVQCFYRCVLRVIIKWFEWRWVVVIFPLKKKKEKKKVCLFCIAAFGGGVLLNGGGGRVSTTLVTRSCLVMACSIMKKTSANVSRRFCFGKWNK